MNLAVRPLKYAAIDVGTHAVRCLIAAAEGDGDFQPLEDIRIPTGLGSRLSGNAIISKNTYRRLMTALSRIMEITAVIGIDAVSITGTSALRTAENGGEIARTVSERLGIPFRIISGTEEARIAFKGAVHSVRAGSSIVAMVDIGGGSTEIALGGPGGSDFVSSMEMGAVNLTDRLIRSDPVSAADMNNLKITIGNILRGACPDIRGASPLLIGTGGTFSTLAAVHKGFEESPGIQHGYAMSQAALVWTVRMLVHRNVEELRRTRGIPYDRAKYVVAGAVLAREIMKFIGSDRLVLSERGFREGLMMELVEKFEAIRP